MDDLLGQIKTCAAEHGVAAVYVVGLQDTSIFSDFDLVVVYDGAHKRRVLSSFQSLGSVVDVRFVGGTADFVALYPYWSYADMRLVYGSEMRPSIVITDQMKLVKMAAMFFKSFLRNYYRHARDTQINTRQLLVDLNDFNYCPKYLSEVPVSVVSCIEKINEYRTNAGAITQAQARELLNEAIGAAWVLIEVLNKELQKEFLVKHTTYLFLGQEPTLIVPATTTSCRQMSENLNGICVQAKILYLPLGFQFISFEDTYIHMFRTVNMHCGGKGLLLVVRWFGKKVLAVAVYLHFRLSGS